MSLFVQLVQTTLQTATSTPLEASCCQHQKQQQKQRRGQLHVQQQGLRVWLRWCHFYCLCCCLGVALGDACDKQLSATGSSRTCQMRRKCEHEYGSRETGGLTPPINYFTRLKSLQTKNCMLVPLDILHIYCMLVPLDK
jgi:hypothetical protein